MAREIRVLFILLAFPALVGTAGAQDQLRAARDLYASAAYEEALTALSQVHDGGAAAAVSDQVEQYRAFCLFALGRTVEARSVAERLISKSPLVEIDSADASPRIIAMFSDVRKRVLPTLIRDEYRAARAVLENRDFAAAQAQFAKVQTMLDQADNVGVQDATLGDLRVLVEGFAELARESAPHEDPAPLAASTSQPAATSAPAPVRVPPRIYAKGDSDVVAPVILRQDIPPIPRELLRFVVNGPRLAVIDVLVDESGNVERAVVRQSFVPMYDGLLISAARKWKYQPALKGETPVKFLKTIEVLFKNVAPAAPMEP
jgi:hypothetical protein